jgi:hypothetical protein
MSQASSDLDDPFGNAVVEADAGGDYGTMSEEGMVAPAPQYRKQGFSIYSVMLILSFVFLMASAIMFFVNAGKF